MSEEVDPQLIEESFAEYRRTQDRRIRDLLVESHADLATRCARRFANRGEPLDDLTQVAMFGLLKAVERFDPDLGTPFGAFATPRSSASYGATSATVRGR